jgi:hypothetical protein
VGDPPWSCTAGREAEGTGFRRYVVGVGKVGLPDDEAGGAGRGAAVRGPWKTDPHGTARPARCAAAVQCSAVPAGGVGVVRPAGIISSAVGL